jgi:3-oxoacyl-(acyl-carrier-protein) synthase
MNDPIVITGIGILSPLGIGMEETIAALREGDSALLPCARFQPPEGVSPLAGEVPGFQMDAFGVSPKTYLDRTSELLLAAAGQALQHAGLADTASRSPERTGLQVGTAWGCLDTQSAFFADYVQKGPRLVKPLLFPHAYFNTAISLVAIEWSLRGPHQAFASGRAASGQALVEACDLLRDGLADVMLAGGCEALGPTRFRALAASGLAPGEAGVMLVLERRSHAATRGAPVLATVLGAGLGTDSCGRAGDGVATAIRAALSEAAQNPAELACVCASANGCTDVDERESQALRQVFAESAPPTVLSFASLCGDTAGATAALHTVLAIGMRANGVVPPTSAPACDPAPATPLLPGPMLVLATDPTGSTVALVLI